MVNQTTGVNMSHEPSQSSVYNKNFLLMYWRACRGVYFFDRLTGVAVTK
jgi:hypothetical protein